MRLKRLILQGYKTFATKTEFVFDQGITAIVGPNGSGKSNLADAVRWVLGEQGYSTLRGRRTEDMIFAGSQGRARAGMAQAILTLDNSEGWLPIEFSEVEIGRRAHRSGENEYILNGHKVRLRDIEELLAHSALAERTYTIIGQGLVDQALSLRAEERRALFEEAAGVSHYKARRAETLRRLQETQHNLERVQDILADIEPRLISLKRQAQRARAHDQVAADLRQLLRLWYGYQWEQARSRLRRQRQETADVEAAWQEARQNLRLHQERVDVERKRLHTLQRQLREQEALREAQREKLEQAHRQAAIWQERRLSLERQLAEVDQDLPGVVAQQAAGRSEQEQALAELAPAQSRLMELEGERQRFQAAFLTQQAEVEQERRALEQLGRDLRAAQQRLAQAEGQLSQLQERREEAVAATAEGDDPTDLDSRIARLRATFETESAGLAALQQRRAAAQQEQRRRLFELEPVRQELAEAGRQLAQAGQEVARLQARRDLLEQLLGRQSAAGPSEPTTVPVIGRLAAMMTIPPDLRPAIEAILAERLAAVIVAAENDLWALVRHRNGQPIVAISVANVQSPPDLPAPDHPAALGWVADLVGVEDAYRPLVRLLLGRALLVRNARAAYELAFQLPAGCLAATPDGFIAHAGGLVEQSRADPDDGLLAREEALRLARSALEEQQVRQASLEAALTHLEAAVAARQAASDERAREESRLGLLEQEASPRLVRAQRELDQAQQQRAFLDRQRQSQVDEAARLDESSARVEAAIAGQQREVSRLEAAGAAAQTRFQALPRVESRQQEQSHRQSVEAARAIVAGRQAVVDSRRATLSQVDGQLRRLQQRREELVRRLDEAAQADAAGMLAQLQRAAAAIEEVVEPRRQEIGRRQDHLAALEAQSVAQQRQLHDQDSAYTQARIGLSQQENSLESLRERIRADLGLVALRYDEDEVGQSPLPMAGVVDELPVLTELPEDIEEAIQRYRGQVHRLGAVNPEAPAEYDEVQQRYEFLTQQVEDLGQTDRQLRQVIAELDHLTSRSFAQTVEKVDTVFGEMFTRLFGGGAARLVLTDPDDLTISGVEIVARLPNRRQQGLGLLSGGERSLTAAALIFALLKVSPTPFCILDEVDAMLDEANVNRFRDVLRELSVRTQFIVITHNRGTVEAAQTIYGISMGAESASQVISVRPEEYIYPET